MVLSLETFSLQKVTATRQELVLTHAVFIEYFDELGQGGEPSLRSL